MYNKIGFIGLGLMGGSIAKSIRKYHLSHEIVAFDQDAQGLKSALSDGTIDCFTTSLDHNFSDCDLIFLCCPVKINAEMAAKLSHIISPHCLLTDIGSTKEDIHNAMLMSAPNQPFIGGHPMTGSEKSGYIAADPRLFENIYYVLTKSPTASEDVVEQFTSFVKAIDSIPILMDPKSHDQATAAISHVPHIIATSLVNAVAHMDYKNGYMHTLASGGFKDLTRIASGSPVMWESICLANRDAILTALDHTQSAINDMYKAIETSSGPNMFERFTTAKDYRDSFNDVNPGLLPRQFTFSVDVDDEPGIIARIATLLYEASINIKNIGVVNNREIDHGVLQIHFSDQHHMDKSLDLLKSLGFTIYQ